MKIALLGYGKMGKAIEEIAIKQGHQIVLKIDKDPAHFDIKKADVAIDFSVPGAAVNNISMCLKHNIPVVSGTTGWLNNYNDMVNLCHEKGGAFLYASNFSLGVNIFFELNTKLAQLMSSVEHYRVSIEEIHHTQKLDAPSGTAISLAEDIIINSEYTNWDLNQKKESKTIPIYAKRIDTTPGTHTITYGSDVDTISIRHTAHNRQGFAMGALVAAQWLLGKKGVFTMKDVLNIG
jgi:4-hydroxy-tetrahydrodipicolinate reductase